LRILHILAPGLAGGLESVVRALASGHARRGHEAHVAVIGESDEAISTFTAAVASGGVRVHPLVLPPRSYRAERQAVGALIDRVAPEVVHTHGYRPDVLDAPVARARGVPTVTTVHGFTGGGARNRIYEWLQRRAFRRFDAVVAVSAPLAASLAEGGVQRARVHLVRNAWDGASARLEREEARAALGILPGEVVVGWVGRASREKGLDVLIDAVPALADLDLRFSVIGDGREVEACRTRAAAIGAADRIRWHGALADAGRLFGAFDVFALSSRTEGTPMVLFEAAASGVPIVAARVGGVPDVFGADQAWLVQPDDPAALASAIRAAIAEPEEAARRAEAARHRLETGFRPDRWLDEYESIYGGVARSAAVPITATSVR
jgi:glycosyltransferase involved in cell wall biosynthesis